MAEIILSPIAEWMIETLCSAAVEEIKSLWGVEDGLEELKQTLETIKAVLADAEKRQLSEEHVKLWLQRLKAVFYKADDLVDKSRCRRSAKAADSRNENKEEADKERFHFVTSSEEIQPARRERDDSHSFCRRGKCCREG
ncbi:hypothetical protein TIFTF001_027691 [Ficus carica]|uniref:Disease resistance N-terminal domain-containing protein n=1 Tax=Ficus carica TaxID=3494 RepID=A0AA88DFZ5_FICCA|nr:hypothetical protein TIFTF001_026016 [Ficus carica]GMN58591.1 hypothetical protein TIFTF001_027691 [Ficus carica]